MVHDCYALDDGHECGVRDAKRAGRVPPPVTGWDQSVQGRMTYGVDGFVNGIAVFRGSSPIALSPNAKFYAINGSYPDSKAVVFPASLVKIVSGPPGGLSDPIVNHVFFELPPGETVPSISGFACISTSNDGIAFSVPVGFQCN